MKIIKRIIVVILSIIVILYCVADCLIRLGVALLVFPLRLIISLYKNIKYEKNSERIDM
jgi:hypothetical protein